MNVACEIFFLKNYTQNVLEKLVPDPFLKIKIENVSGSIVLHSLFSWIVLYSLFLLYVKWVC